MNVSGSEKKKLLVWEREKSGDLGGTGKKKITSPREREERRPGETGKKRIISLKERGRAETLVVQEKKKKYQSCILRSQTFSYEFKIINDPYCVECVEIYRSIHDWSFL